MTKRALGLAATLALVAVIAACGEEDPVAPGIGFPETAVLNGNLAQGASVTLSSQLIANRTGTMHARLCAVDGNNIDLAVTRTPQRDVVDTVAAETATTACESLQFAVTEGTVYRFRLSGVTGTGAYTLCWSYTASDCAALAPISADTGYYKNAQGLTGAALLQALHGIVKTGYNGYQYDSARGWLYQDVEDPDDDNLIEDLYVGRIATVVRRANDAFDATDANFNAEHTWPQSCGARLDRVTSNARSTGPAGDLNIIFAADETANSRRLNYPFGIVSGTPTWVSPADSAGNTSKLGTNAQGLTVFEPRAEKKGDVARAIFYFYVRYVPEIPTSLSLANFNVEEEVLKQWAQQDPPDAFERARNDEVFKVQGNRNPFIDHPEYLAAIGDFSNSVSGTHATCNF